MVLHPLKSELNWPLGDKAPLDLALGATADDRDSHANRIASAAAAASPLAVATRGLRWRLPYFLIDAG